MAKPRDRMKESRARIESLYPQFNSNTTIQRAYTSDTAVRTMVSLCIHMHKRYSEESQASQWSHLLNSLNKALVDRIRDNKIRSSGYTLQTRDAVEAMTYSAVDSAKLSAKARVSNMVENSDGIMTRRHKSVGLADTSSLESSVSRQPSADSEYDPVKQSRSPLAPPVPATISERQLYKTYFDDPTLSDLTIKLGDRTVQVHRIVLCRVSEHFVLLLKDNLQVC
jgi:hypothetical protein